MANANTSGAIARIAREIQRAQKSNDLSIAVACRDNDVRNVRALIIGPPDTPYEFGFFEFNMKFPREYPIKPPLVKCSTTNGGRCRFNPNIYAEGKVCLSIIGTWRGEPGEGWSSAQGLETVLLSIQSLMSPNPYENEPGFEKSDREEEQPRAYIAKIRHETLRISVLQRLEALLDIKVERPDSPRKKQRTNTFKSTILEEWIPSAPDGGELLLPENSSHMDDALDKLLAFTPSPEAAPHEYDANAAIAKYDLAQWDPFADLMKRRFLWYYDAYMRNIVSHSGEHDDGTAFKRMDFESPGTNSMEGQFEYGNLKKRLEVVFAKLEDELAQWLSAGATQAREQSQLATQLAFQFKQLQHKWNEEQYPGSKMEISLPIPENPFKWQLCLFGEPMTNLDGGVWNMKMHIPPNFPDAQPRVIVETPIFHHRVSSKGVLCYFPEKDEEISSHLQAIFAALEDKSSCYDPRAMVNPDAFTLYWGGDGRRKAYNRNLRRSAQNSTDPS